MANTFNTFDTTPNAAGYSAGDSAAPGLLGSLGSLVGGLSTASTVISVLRRFGPPLLGLLSLGRKRGPLGTLVLFGTGFAVGAGTALVLTPMPGDELRRTLLERIKGLSGEAKRDIVTAEHKAEEIAGKVKDSVVEAEHKAEEIAGKVKDSVVEAEHKIETKVHDLVDEVMAVLQSSGHYTELRKAGATNGKGNGHSNGKSKHHMPAGAAGTAVN